MQQDREEMKEFVQTVGATYGRLGMGRPWRAVCGRKDTQPVLQHSCSEQKSVRIARVLANAGDRKFGKCLKYCPLNGQVQCSGLKHTDQICWS